MFGVTTFAGSSYCVMFSATSTPPTFPAPDVLPIQAWYSYAGTPPCSGVTLWTTSSDPNCAAFLDGLIPFDADAPTTLYVFYKGNYAGGIMGTSRHGLNSVENAARASQVFLLGTTATPAPTLSSPFVVNLLCNNLFFIYPPSGATFFASGGDLTRAALLEGLCTMDQSLTGYYLHNLGSRSVFYSNTRMPGIYSTPSTVAMNAWYLSSSAALPSIQSSPLSVMVSCKNAVYGLDSMNSGVYGIPGAYTSNSDLRAAAIHQGLINYGAADTVIYVYDQGETKDGFLSLYQNGVFSQAAGTGVSIQLTAKPFIPQIQGTSVTPFTLTRSFTKCPSSLYGSTLYYEQSEIGSAAIHSGLANLSTTVTLYIHYLGLLSNPCFYGADNNGIRSYESDCSTCKKFILSTSPTTNGYNPGTPDMTWIYIANYQPNYYSASGLTFTGMHLFGLTTNVVVAAWAMRMLNRGDTKRLYLWSKGDQWFLKAGMQRGYPSGYGRIAVPGKAFFISTTLTPAAGDDPIISGSGTKSYSTLYRYTAPAASPFYLPTSTLYGCNEYYVISDLSMALEHMGLLLYDGVQRSIYVHHVWPGGSPLRRWNACRNRWFASTFSTGSEPYMASYWPSTDPVAANFVQNKYTLTCGPQESTIYGTEYYLWYSDICTMARHAGLLTPTDLVATIYLSYLRYNPKQFYRAFRNGYRSTPLWSPNEAAVKVSLNPPTTSPSINQDLFATVVTPGFYCAWYVCGYMYYRYDSCIERAALMEGYLENAPVKLYVNRHDESMGRYLGMSSASFVTAPSVDSYGGFRLSNESAPLPPYDGTIITLRALAVGQTSSAQGAGYCYIDNDLTVSAFVAGVIPTLFQWTTFYAYKTTRRFVYGGQRSGIFTAGAYWGTQSDVYYISAAPTGIPTFDKPTVQAVRLFIGGFPRVGTTLVGVQRYSITSDYTLAALHSHLYKVGDWNVTVYLHYQATAPCLYSYEGLGILSSYQLSPTNVFVIKQDAATPSLPADRTTFWVRLNTFTNPGFHGTGVYRYTTAIQLAALHSGWFRFGDEGWVTVHHIASHDTFVAMPYGKLQSSALQAVDTAFMIGCVEAPLQSCRYPGTRKAVVWAWPRNRQLYGTIYGGPNLFAASSDLESAIVFRGLIQKEEQGELLLTIYPTPGDFTSNSANGIQTRSGAASYGFSLEPVVCISGKPPCRATATQEMRLPPTRTRTKTLSVSPSLMRYGRAATPRHTKTAKWIKVQAESVSFSASEQLSYSASISRLAASGEILIPSGSLLFKSSSWPVHSATARLPNKRVIVGATTPLVTKTAVRTVASAATVVSVMTGLLSPQAATRGSRLGLVGSPLRCLFQEDLTPPEVGQYLANVAIVVDDEHQGVKTESQYAGGCVTSASLVLFFTIAAELLAKINNRLTLILLRLVALLEFTASVYFLPNIVMALVVVVRQSQNIILLAATSVSAFICLLPLLLIVLRTVRGFHTHLVTAQHPDEVTGTVKWEFLPKDNVPNETATSINNKGGILNPSEIFLQRTAPLYDSVRLPAHPLFRLCCCVEILLGVVMGAAAGWRPPPSDCADQALAVLFICVIALVWSIAARPSVSKLDLFFLIITNLLLLLSSALGYIMIQIDPTKSPAFFAEVKNVVDLAASGGFLVQLLVTVFWRVAVRNRRQVLERSRLAEETSTSDAPLLPTPPAAETSSPLHYPVPIPPPPHDEVGGSSPAINPLGQGQDSRPPVGLKSMSPDPPRPAGSIKNLRTFAEGGLPEKAANRFEFPNPEPFSGRSSLARRRRTPKRPDDDTNQILPQ